MSHEWVFDFQSSPTGRVWYTCKKCDASACTDVGEGTEHLLPKDCVADSISDKTAGIAFEQGRDSMRREIKALLQNK